MNEEIVKADISACKLYIKYLSPFPLEVILIHNFTMSFQLGDNSIALNRILAKVLFKREEVSMSELFSKVTKNRYYKCIAGVNTVVELAILNALVDPDIKGVKYKELVQEDNKLLCYFYVLR